MKEILDVIHKTIYQFFDTCDDDEEVPISDKDKLLLEVNKAICNNLKALEQEPCDRFKLDGMLEDAYEHGYDQAKHDYETQSCEDAVSREAFKDMFCEMHCHNERSKCAFRNICKHMNRVSALPPVAPQPKTGHWIDDKCSVCGKGTEDLISSCEWYRNEEPNFCTFCGIKMVELQESEE